MKIKLFILLSFLAVSTSVFAQEGTNTIEEQFVKVVDEANNYQDYKVIKKTQITTLRNNIMDSIAALRKSVQSAKQNIAQQKSEILTLNQDLKTTREDLEVSKQKEDGIEFFGTIMPKSTYNTIMWVIIILLLALVGFLIFQFKRSHAMTKAAELKLAETESEFEAHRQKSLEESQQLGRKLQDEINKNRNS